MSVYFCKKCSHSFNHSPIGRTPLFCSSACRQSNYRILKALRNASLVVEDPFNSLRNSSSFQQVDRVGEA